MDKEFEEELETGAIVKLGRGLYITLQPRASKKDKRNLVKIVKLIKKKKK